VTAPTIILVALGASTIFAFVYAVYYCGYWQKHDIKHLDAESPNRHSADSPLKSVEGDDERVRIAVDRIMVVLQERYSWDRDRGPPNSASLKMEVAKEWLEDLGPLKRTLERTLILTESKGSGDHMLVDMLRVQKALNADKHGRD
jgi:hypothetical protein